MSYYSSFVRGEKTASNLILLCKRCHLENPNVSDPKIMWDWLKAYKEPFYDTFWTMQGFREYEKIYGISLEEDIMRRKIFDTNKFMKLLKEQVKNGIHHFGAPYFNVATLAGFFRMALEKYD